MSRRTSTPAGVGLSFLGNLDFSLASVCGEPSESMNMHGRDSIGNITREYNLITLQFMELARGMTRLLACIILIANKNDANP